MFQVNYPYSELQNAEDVVQMQGRESWVGRKEEKGGFGKERINAIG